MTFKIAETKLESFVHLQRMIDCNAEAVFMHCVVIQSNQLHLLADRLYNMIL